MLRNFLILKFLIGPIILNHPLCVVSLQVDAGNSGAGVPTKSLHKMALNQQTPLPFVEKEASDVKPGLMEKLVNPSDTKGLPLLNVNINLKSDDQHDRNAHGILNVKEPDTIYAQEAAVNTGGHGDTAGRVPFDASQNSLGGDANIDDKPPESSDALLNKDSVPAVGVEAGAIRAGSAEAHLQKLHDKAILERASINKEVSWLLGLLSVLVSCLLSSFSGVYFERVVKRSRQTSLLIRNIQLGMTLEGILYFNYLRTYVALRLKIHF